MSEKTTVQAKGFMVYRESALSLSLMNDDDAAKAIKAAANYFLYGELPEELPKVAERAFEKLRDDIDRGLELYAATCERNKKNAQNAGRKPKSNGETPERNILDTIFNGVT